MEVTLRKLRQYHACASGYNKLAAHVTGQKLEQVYGHYVDIPDEWQNRPIPLLTILKSNDLDDTMWAARALDRVHDRDLRLLAREFALLCRPECPEEHLELFDRAMTMVKDAADGKVDLDNEGAEYNEDGSESPVLKLRNELYAKAHNDGLRLWSLSAACSALRHRHFSAVWNVPDYVELILGEDAAVAKCTDLCVQTFTGQSWWQQ